MFYCIHCRELHVTKSMDQVFRTGFREMPSGEKLPLGACSEEAERMKQKVDHIRAERSVSLPLAIALSS